MNLDPQKFFIGLMDFFSILLPCALLTYLLMGELGSAVLGDRYAQLAGAQAWAAFLFTSDLFGRLVFLLGSWLDEVYDWARALYANHADLWISKSFIGYERSNCAKSLSGVRSLSVSKYWWDKWTAKRLVKSLAG